MNRGLILSVIFWGTLLVAIIYVGKNFMSSTGMANLNLPGSTVLVSNFPKVYLPPMANKASHCLTNGPFPDTGCTPGTIFPNISVDQICKTGYSASVRNVTEELKKEIYQSYGIFHHATGQYEIDHLISLELGGSNDAANLWPEAALPKPGFHEKDQVENYLHWQVCDGKMTLAEAQRQIATDWLSVYRTIPTSFFESKYGQLN